MSNVLFAVVLGLRILDLGVSNETVNTWVTRSTRTEGTVSGTTNLKPVE